MLPDLHVLAKLCRRLYTIERHGPLLVGAEEMRPAGRSQLLASQLSEPKLKQAAKTISDQAHILSSIITELMAIQQQPITNLQAKSCEMRPELLLQRIGGAAQG